MKKLSNVLVLIAVLSLIAGPAIGAELAKPSFGATSVQWDAQGPYERLVLTVSTPGGKVVRQEVGAGQTPEFDLSSVEGAADGAYTWELRLIPKFDAEVRKALAEARRKGDDAAVERMRAEGKIPADRVQSGSFLVEAGSFVAPGETEHGTEGVKSAKDAAKNITAADQVIPDDLIVQGSECVGLDCVNNENFGFDTLRLKENNTRIHFDDTSTSAGFPANDWRLIANDSASGGSSKFSIEDSTSSKTPFTVTAGAATNSIFVDSTGRVGLRTSTPVLDLHINTSNTPAIRLEQNNSGGFTAQTWDIGANEANFFVRDVTGGSKLSFRIRPGAPTSSIDISADGDVGIGTASPGQKLHVSATVDANEYTEMENASTGTSALAGFRAQADVVQTNLQSHSSTRAISRFGKTLNSVSELLSAGGNGMVIGTLEADDLILGTNNTNRLQINGSTGAVTVSGNFTVTGVKNFAMVDPADAQRAIYYASLEGPEAGTYFRGTAKIKNGEAVIELPGYFSRITETERMTVQLTPVGDWGQLYVAEKTPERLVIRVAPGTSDLTFDYLVQGVRKGYLDFEVERANNLPK
jgi:hypothetical protein